MDAKTTHSDSGLKRFLDDFQNDPQLDLVYAFRNNITSVEGAFTNVGSLEVVLLQNNSLRTIHRKSFPASLEKLRTLAVDGMRYSLPISYTTLTFKNKLL